MPTPLPNPFITDPERSFAPDMTALAAELEDELRKHVRAPVFLSDPMTAVELMPIVELLARY